MRSPFVFSKIVTGEKFVGRENEIKKLNNNFRDGINTFIISPRRTGKSSLVNQSIQVYKEKQKEKNKVVFVFVNLWNVRSESEFYELFANRVLKATTSKFTEVIEAAKTFLGNLTPNVKLEYESVQLEIGLSHKKEELKAILDLPQKIAEKMKKNIVVCLDEFQDIEYFNDSLSFQKNLRAHWQAQKNVSYILFGSKKHMLSNLFNDASMPFYRFGDVLYLKKINEKKLQNFIIKSFNNTKKTIMPDDALYITRELYQHPYYIQQYCNILWQNVARKVTKDNIRDSMDEFIEYNSGQFEIIIKGLSTTQLNFLKALSNMESSFHSQHVLSKYSLGSSANVTSIKKVLVDKEIIEENEGVYSFTDPALEIYFKRKIKKD